MNIHIPEINVFPITQSDIIFLFVGSLLTLIILRFMNGDQRAQTPLIFVSVIFVILLFSAWR